jgi:endonuclease YncB( thermonuclease family)
MSFASRIVTALLGLALIWYFWPFGGGAEVVTPVPPPPDGRLFTKPASPAPQAAAPKPAAAQPTASVQDPPAKPHLLAREKADAERVAALTTETVPKPVLKPKLYYRVVVRDAGTLEAKGVVITLDGIKAHEADDQCKDAKGRAWACGARARTALTRLIRGRAVSCKVPSSSKQTSSGKQTSLTARCSVGGVDLSVWMLSQGWAQPAAQAEPKLAAVADEARKKKVGLWR